MNHFKKYRDTNLDLTIAVRLYDKTFGRKSGESRENS